MQRAFRCPECRNVVTVAAHVFPVCPRCGYTRRGEARAPVGAQEWAPEAAPQAVEPQAEAVEAAPEATDEWATGEAQWAADDRLDPEGAGTGDGAGEPDAWAESEPVDTPPEANPVAKGARRGLALTLVTVAGVLVLAAIALVLVDHYNPEAGGGHLFAIGLVCLIVGALLGVGGVVMAAMGRKASLGAPAAS